MLGVLHDELSRQSEDFKTVKSELSSAAVLIMHPVNSELAEYFKSVSLLDFYSSLKEENFAHIRTHTQKTLALFKAKIHL